MSRQASAKRCGWHVITAGGQAMAMSGPWQSGVRSMKQGVTCQTKVFGGQSCLTGGPAEGLRVIELLPDQHHLSNVMSLNTSSLITQTHSATVVVVKRLEGETLYCLSNQRTHIVSINYQVEGPVPHRNLVSI